MATDTTSETTTNETAHGICPICRCLWWGGHNNPDNSPAPCAKCAERQEQQRAQIARKSKTPGYWWGMLDDFTVECHTTAHEAEICRFLLSGHKLHAVQYAETLGIIAPLKIGEWFPTAEAMREARPERIVLDSSTPEGAEVLDFLCWALREVRGEHLLQDVLPVMHAQPQDIADYRCTQAAERQFERMLDTWQDGKLRPLWDGSGLRFEQVLRAGLLEDQADAIIPSCCRQADS